MEGTSAGNGGTLGVRNLRIPATPGNIPKRRSQVKQAPFAGNERPSPQTACRFPLGICCSPAPWPGYALTARFPGKQNYKFIVRTGGETLQRPLKILLSAAKKYLGFLSAHEIVIFGKSGPGLE